MRLTYRTRTGLTGKVRWVMNTVQLSLVPPKSWWTVHTENLAVIVTLPEVALVFVREVEVDAVTR